MKRLFYLVSVMTIILLLNGCTPSNEFMRPKQDWFSMEKHDLQAVQNYIQYYGPCCQPGITDSLDLYDLNIIGWMDKWEYMPAKISLQYIAVMEASEAHRTYHAWLKDVDSTWRLFNNPYFSGTWIMNVADTNWQNFVLNVGITWTMSRGGEGLLLDTFGDIELLLGNWNKYLVASVDFIKKIRQRYPNLILVVNEPGQLIYYIADDVDGIILEQFMFDLNGGQQFVTPRQGCGGGTQEFNKLVNFWQTIPAEKRFKIFTMDMVAGDNPVLAKISIDQATLLGFIPTITPMSGLGNRYQKIPSPILRQVPNYFPIQAQ